MCNHPYLLDEQWNLGDDNVVRVCGKFDVLDRILPKLKSAGHRVLIYSQVASCVCLFCERILRAGGGGRGGGWWSATFSRVGVLGLMSAVHIAMRNCEAGFEHGADLGVWVGQMVKLLDVLQQYVEFKGYTYRKLIGATSR